MSQHFEKSYCWWRGSTKKNNEIALWVQVACTATALAVCVARPYDMPGTYRCSIVASAYNRNINKERHMAWVHETTLYIRLIAASSFTNGYM